MRISYDKLFTVGDLKRKLAQIPDEVAVVVRTHFGDGLPVPESAFEWKRSPTHVVEDAWEFESYVEVPSVLMLEPPYIGTEPD